MTRHERLSAILGIVVEEGSIHIDDIITRLNVSAATARRDLDLLANQQLVTRTRGGAYANRTSAELPLRYRASRMADEKTRIARAATALVRAGDTVGLNGGTTTTEVAREIALLPVGIDPDRPVTVVTNAVNIASELTVRQNVRVVVTLSDLILPRISVDTTFLGVDGMDATGAYAFHEGEAAVNYALARAAQRVVVVADHTKLSRSTFALICRADEINMLITDIGATEEQLAPIREAGITIRQV